MGVKRQYLHVLLASLLLAGGAGGCGNVATPPDAEVAPPDASSADTAVPPDAAQADAASDAAMDASADAGPDLMPPETTIDSFPPDVTGSQNAEFTFSSSEEGSTFACRVDDAPFAACVSPFATTVAGGAHVFEVAATDGSGNADPTPAQAAWTVDVTAPQTTIVSAPPAADRNNTATFTFTATEPGIFECSLNDAAFLACGTPTVLTDLADGAHMFFVRAIDDVGNEDPTPAGHTWTVDTVAPDTAIASGPTGTVASNSAAFTFTSTEAGTFECSLDSAPFAACASPANFTVGDGGHELQVRAVDQAGNTDATPAAQAWVVDATPPDTAITSGPSATTNQTTATLVFTSEANATFVCSEDGGAFIACTSPHTWSSLSDGAHAFAVKAIDTLGNIDPTPATWSWTVDNTPPDTNITLGPPALNGTTTVTFEFTSTETGSFRCSLDGEPFMSCTTGISRVVADGSHEFQVSAVDAVGNVDPTPASRVFTVDSTPPDGSIVSGPDTVSGATSATFFFVSTEAGTFRCARDGGAAFDCTSPHEWSSLSNGAHSLAVTAIDPAGNADPSPATWSWTVDTTQPDTVITSEPATVTNQTSATFEFYATAGGSTFQCSNDDGAWFACVSPYTRTPVADGARSFEVKAVAGTGIPDPTPATRGWTVDTVRPDTSVVDKPSSVTNQATATFTFSSTEAGSTFSCSNDGGGYSPCSSPFVRSSLSAGAHSFAVKATDPAGNTDASPASWSWTVDLTAPDTEILTGPSSFSNQTSATFTFASTEAGSTFECKLDSGAFASCGSPKIYSSLTAGVHTFRVRATDAAGNLDSSEALTNWTVDLTDPDTSITGSPASPTNQTSATFVFSSEAGATFQCKLDSSAYAGCTSPKTYSSLGAGSHTVYVKAIDLAGNEDPTPDSKTWTIDLTAPNTTISSGPTNPTTSDSATFVFASTEAGSTFKCKLDSGTLASCSSPKAYSSLADGAHTFYVQATDPAGNEDATAATWSWTVDPPPETSITGSPLAASNRDSAVFTFSSPDAGATFECKLNSGSYAACTSPKTYTRLSVAAHAFNVRAKDAGGNYDPTPASFPWTVTEDPILKYQFAGNADNVGALSGYNGTGRSVTYTTGKFGMAVKFASSSSSDVTLPGTRTVLSADSKYTIGLWFKEDSVRTSSTLLDCRGATGGIESYHGASGTSLTTCYSASPSGSGCSSFSYIVGTWHHLIFRYDGTSTSAGGGAPLEVYLDDVLVATVANASNNVIFSSSVVDLVLGKNSNFYVDDLRIHNNTYTRQQQCESIILGVWNSTTSTCGLP